MYWKATDLVYFSSTSQQILLYPFVLVMICVLGVLDDLLCVVQPQELWRCKDWLHVRSPQDLPLIVASCWLDLDRQRGEEVRVMECAFLRVPCTRPFLAPPPPILEGIPFLDIVGLSLRTFYECACMFFCLIWVSGGHWDLSQPLAAVYHSQSSTSMLNIWFAMCHDWCFLFRWQSDIY